MDDGRFQGPPTFQIFLLRQRIMRFQLFPGILFRGPHDIPVVRCIFRIARFASCDCAEESDGDALFRHTHQSHVRIVRGNRLQSSRNIACGALCWLCSKFSKSCNSRRESLSLPSRKKSPSIRHCSTDWVELAHSREYAGTASESRTETPTSFPPGCLYRPLRINLGALGHARRGASWIRSWSTG